MLNVPRAGGSVGLGPGVGGNVSYNDDRTVYTLSFPQIEATLKLPIAPGELHEGGTWTAIYYDPGLLAVAPFPVSTYEAFAELIFFTQSLAQSVGGG